MNRRRALLASTLLTSTVLLSSPAWANSDLISLIVPYPPGGSSDVFARTISPALGRELGKTVIVENVSGASGSIAAAKVLAGSRTGETLFMASPTEVILAPELLKSAAYKAEDFALLGLIDRAPLTLFTRTNLPVSTIDELLAYARQPGAAPLTYGTTGPGSFYHLATNGLQQLFNVPMTHVPYRGGAPMQQDLVAGNIDFIMLPASITTGSLAEAGRIKPIAVAGEARNLRLPEVPTFQESQNLAAYRAPDMWAGLMVAANTSAERKAALHAALSRVLQQPEVHATLSKATAGPVPEPLSLAEAEAFYQEQIHQLRTAIQAAALEAN